MCMDKPYLECEDRQSNRSIIETEEYPPESARYPISSSENSPTSGDENDIIEFGPIKVKPRKKPAPTLATGRRSKYETLSPEEEHKRELRRARNRAAAERVRISRLNIEQQLQGQIDGLKYQEHKLLTNVQILRDHKLDLETRLLAHQKVCSPVTTPYTLGNLMSTYTLNDTPTSTTFQQVSELNFDELFAEPSSTGQNQQNNISNSLTTITPSDDFDDFLMDL